MYVPRQGILSTIVFPDPGGGGGGDDRCPKRGSEATERGEGVGGEIPRRDFFQNRILEHLKNDILGN